jgi:hypothetical protein
VRWAIAAEGKMFTLSREAAIPNAGLSDGRSSQ